MDQQQMSLWIYGEGRDELKRQAAFRRNRTFRRFWAVASKRLAEDTRALLHGFAFRHARLSR